MIRLLDLDRAALAALAGRDLLAAVAGAEGRTVVAEVIAGSAPLADPADNVEVVAAMGADLLLLNRIEEAMAGGAWMHHLGDAGLGGSPDPEVVYRYSVAIRGRRHTWHRMALGARGAATP